MASTNWSAARKHSFIVSVLRSGTRRWPAKYETLNEAKTEKRLNERTGRLAQHYHCSKCGNDYPAKQVQVDHTRPVVCPQTGFTTWDEYISRLFCDKDNLAVMCIPCHKLKSASERNTKEKLSKSTKPSKPKKAPSSFKES